ncbi:MAG: hypothetical protein J5718_00025 [Lachnospiraceae bacterium]|nr:hypothetical protein [Lachnospiraceae bacterium]
MRKKQAIIAICLIVSIFCLSGCDNKIESDVKTAVSEPAVIQTFDILDVLDAEAQAVSAKRPGNETKFFESWNDAVEYIGIVPWNPFENADWLEKMNCAGADIKDPDTGVINHCCLSTYGSDDGDAGYASLQTGYAFGKIRVVIIDYISASNFSDNLDQYAMIKYYNLYKENGNILARECTGENQDYNCVVGVLNSESAVSVRIKLYKNNEIKYEISIVSLETKEDLKAPFNRICTELYIPLEYDTIMKETAEKKESEDLEDENTVYVPKTEIDMIPVETDLDGSHNGYFVVTIDGKKYRYKMASAQNESITAGDLVYKWEDKGDTCKFYEVKEYPDLKRLKCVHTENGFKHDFVIMYAAPEALPEGTLEEIINDGFVVMKNGSVISGEDEWQEFVKKTEVGETAEINIAHYYTLTGRMAKNLYELSKMDYPTAYLHRLKYDGNCFVFTPLQKIDGKYEIMPDNENDREQTYKYMKHYTEKAPSDTALFTTFDKYVLVNDDTVTWEDIWNATIGITEGFWHTEVYNKYDYKDGANPEKLITVDTDY